jgi:hypothetical protein
VSGGGLVVEGEWWRMSDGVSTGTIEKRDKKDLGWKEQSLTCDGENM